MRSLCWQPSLYLLAGISLCIGCSRELAEKPVEADLTIYWEGSVYLEDAKFYVEDEFVGEGAPGFEVVLSEIDILDTGSEIMFEAPIDHWFALQEEIDSIELFPFDRTTKYYMRFTDYVVKKQLKTSKRAAELRGDGLKISDEAKKAE